eukprot:gene9579-10586_t
MQDADVSNLQQIHQIEFGVADLQNSRICPADSPTIQITSPELWRSRHVGNCSRKWDS